MGETEHQVDQAEGHIRQALDWASEHPQVDAWVAGIAVTIHTTAVMVTGHWDVLGWLKLDQLQKVIASGAGIVSVLGGLTSISFAVYQSADGRRATAVRQSHGKQLRANWRWALAATALAAILCLTALVIVRPEGGHWARFVFEGAIFLWAISYVRLLWLFDALIGVRDEDRDDVQRAAAPEVNPRFTRVG
jgi:hypothetical protein